MRGGIEHGLGHFVSSVEPGTEAHLQGLRPGDQLLKVDSMSLIGATHKEVVNLIMSRPHSVELEVKSVGVIPIKDRRDDPVTWKTVEKSHETIISVPQQRPSEHLEARVVIDLGPKPTGLGCSICRGPISKPGIFIQSTKPGGLARDAGLRPGDQILDCNGVSFQFVDFNEAVRTLKSSRNLDLLIRKGAGIDLFPGESSGYESSSSSSNGSYSNKKMSILNEIIEEENEVDEGEEEVHHHVSENRLKLEEKMIEEERKRLEEEQERLRREAARLDNERKKFEEEKRMMTIMSNKEEKKKHHSPVTEQRSSDDDSGGLKAAIEKELMRRATNKQSPSAVSTLKVAAESKKSVHANLKNDKHDALMAEFKKAHKKMFNGSISDEETDRIPEPKEEQKLLLKPVNPLPPATILIKPKNPPPPPPPPNNTMAKKAEPPTAADSMASSTSSSVTSKEKEEDEYTVNVPGIPTPDYDGSSPENSPLTLRKKSNSMSSLLQTAPPKRKLCARHSAGELMMMTSSASSSTSSSSASPPLVNKSLKNNKKNRTFNRRHPELASLESFTLTENQAKSLQKKPPPFYFDTPGRDFIPQPTTGSKRSVRFDIGEEGAIASQDYRAANAIGASAANSGSTLGRSSKRTSSTNSSLCSSSSSEEEIRSKNNSIGFQRRKQTMSPMAKANGGDFILSNVAKTFF